MPYEAPRGFGELVRYTVYFQGIWGALVIILGELGSKVFFGFRESRQKVKTLNLKEKYGSTEGT